MLSKQKQHDLIPVMDYGQYQRARKLVHECCNYDNGQCIALDEGDGCVCVQSISLFGFSVLCRWFRCDGAVLNRLINRMLIDKPKKIDEVRT